MSLAPTLTAVFELTDDEWYVGWIEELPGAITQGATLNEARENLQEAVALVLEARRELAAHSWASSPSLSLGG